MVMSAKGRCNMMARRQGRYTYAAVGEVPFEVLGGLLHRLAEPAEE